MMLFLLLRKPRTLLENTIKISCDLKLSSYLPNHIAVSHSSRPWVLKYYELFEEHSPNQRSSLAAAFHSFQNVIICGGYEVGLNEILYIARTENVFVTATTCCCLNRRYLIDMMIRPMAIFSISLCGLIAVLITA